MDFPAKKTLSIRIRTITILLILLVSFIFLFFCSLYLTGVMTSFDDYATQTFNGQVKTRAQALNSEFETRIGGTQNMAQLISDKLRGIMSENGITSAQLEENPELLKTMLFDAGDIIIENLKYVSVTGAFVMLEASNSNEPDNHSAIYLRDFSPGLTMQKNSDLQLLFGPVDFAQQRTITLHSLWSYNVKPNPDGSEMFDFYVKPMQAAFDRPNMNFLSYAYVSPPITVVRDSLRMLAYTFPLIDENGTPYGIVGIEITEEYIKNLLPSEEISFTKSFYSVWVDTDGEFSAGNTISSGAMAKQFFVNDSEVLNTNDIIREKNIITGYTWLGTDENRSMISTRVPIKMYSNNSYYADTNTWFLAGVVPSESLRENSTKVIQSTVVSSVVTLILGIVIIILMGNYIAYPITSLSRDVSDLNPELPVKLKKYGITEIDTLSDSLTEMSDNVTATAARLSNIVSLVDMPLGGFEINYQTNHVFLTESMYRLTGIEHPGEGRTYIEQAVWTTFMESLIKSSSMKTNEITELVCNRQVDGHTIWYKIKSAGDEARTFGLVVDITEDMLQKQRMAYERSYDQLTRLLNRQAFMARVNMIVAEKPDKVGIMMFGDLDNLKHMNDSYGHEMGDIYLKKAAEALSQFKEIGGAVARISGDEFAVYIHGFENDQAAREAFDENIQALRNATVTTPGGKIYELKMSIGISYYPKDSSSMEDLIKYSDFAMYEIKNTVKNSVSEFKAGSYNKNAQSVQKKALLDLFVNESRVLYHFQPIVDARTGEIFAYEALMRPQLREVKTPAEILQLARSQARLYELERMTFYCVAEWMATNFAMLGSKKMFVNSIPKNTLKEEDIGYLVSKYPSLLAFVVIEVTENEYDETGSMDTKLELMRQYNIQFAIDDYGAGYSNDSNLMNFKPDYVKIDISVVRDINKDRERQELVRNSVSYASTRGIRLIAEGVETAEELKTLCALGVDYVQGYYLAYPREKLIGELADDQIKEICEYSNHQA